ncbi:hypothetical protein [Flavisphingomonas formosensis]|uniref:hypothetical protein n=1 Tax=Flavisphingomonas formosensis TaxID=861534 RepID=UPI0018DFC7DF|nr:hypothetical protein [Sphingomonas formosensis]
MRVPLPDSDYPVVWADPPGAADGPSLLSGATPPDDDDPLQLHRDEVRVRQADADLVSGWKAVSAPWFASQGETAARRWQDIRQALDETLSRPLASLENDRQRRLYGEIAALRRGAWQNEASAHATRAAQAFNEAESQRRQDLAQGAIVRGARLGDARAVAEGEQRLIGEIRGRGRRLGLDADAAGTAEAEALNKARADAANHLVAHDPQRARSWVDWHRGLFDPATTERLDGWLRPYAAEQDAGPLALSGRPDATAAAAPDAETRAVIDRSWAKVLDPSAVSLRAIPPADHVRLPPEHQAGIGAAIAANRRGRDPDPDPALFRSLADKARQGRLDVADVRQAWGKLPLRDWRQVDGWQRGGWRDASADAARPAVLATGPIALTPDMIARRNAALAALSAQGIAAAQGALHPDPGARPTDPQKPTGGQISNGGITTRSAGPGEKPTPFTALFKSIAEEQPKLAPDLPGYAQKAIEALGGVDPFTRQIENELSGSFFDTGVDKTKAILQIRAFGKARDPATGELQCPDCAAVGDKLLDYLSDYNAAHPVEAGMVGFGRFSTGAVGTVTELPYRAAGNLVLGTINDVNGDANRIGDFSLHNLYDPLVAANNYYERTQMGQADVLGDTLSLAKRTGRAIADQHHDTKDILDKHGVLATLDARSQGIGEAAGTIAGLATGYGEYRVARELKNWSSEKMWVQSLDPTTISFTQSSVSFQKMGADYNLNSLVKSMRKSGWTGKPIDVVSMPDGTLATIDNTRVLAARISGINVQANVRGFHNPITDPIRQASLMEKGIVPETWGEAALLRINKPIQNATYPDMNPEWSTRYPYGSLYDPVVRY